MANLLKSMVPVFNRIIIISPTTVRYQSKVPVNLHKVSNMDKKFLVWTKKYKSVEDVPSELPVETVDKAKNKMRIRVANYMMAATLVGCLIAVISGKKLRDSGDTLTKRNLEWHARYNEEVAKAEREKQGNN